MFYRLPSARECALFSPLSVFDVLDCRAVINMRICVCLDLHDPVLTFTILRELAWLEVLDLQVVHVA